MLQSADRPYCPWGIQLHSKHSAGSLSTLCKVSGDPLTSLKYSTSPNTSTLVLCGLWTARMCNCGEVNRESSRRVGVNLHSTVSCNTTFFYKLSNGSRKTAALPLNIFFKTWNFFGRPLKAPSYLTNALFYSDIYLYIYIYIFSQIKTK